MNLDALISAGQPPWEPSPAARDIDVWEKPDFPVSGTYRLAGSLVLFTLITTAGGRSLWAYVVIPPDREESVTTSRFATDAGLDVFIKGCFADREAVFAAAQDFVIDAKSDGIRIGNGSHDLLSAGAQWYIARALALRNRPALHVETSDPEQLLITTQDVLAGSAA